MNTLARYLELIVDPTWDDFHSNRRSVRRPFLACAWRSTTLSTESLRETKGEQRISPKYGAANL